MSSPTSPSDLNSTPSGKLGDQIVDAAHACTSFEVGDDRVDLGAQLGLARDDAGDLGVELGDVDGDAGVLGLDVRADRDVVAVVGDDLVVDELGEVGDVLAAAEGVEDRLLVVCGELVLVALPGELAPRRR